MPQKFKRAKIALIGSGQIGGNLALFAAQKQLGDVFMFDIVEGLPQGKALDLNHATAVQNTDCRIVGVNSYAELEGADVCVVTAGIPRKPGMSRDDLLDTNVKIMKDVATNLKQYCPDAFIVVISNPLDAMVYTMRTITGRPTSHVVGMAGVLDSSRFRYFIADHLGVSVDDVTALVLGGHGDTMVPIIQHAAVGGIPLTDLMSRAEIDAIADRTRVAGGEIVGLLKTGSAFVSPAASTMLMVESYLRDRKRVCPAAAFCQGQYGINDLFVGVPVVIGCGGVEKILEFKLSEQDQSLINASAEHVASLVEETKKRL